MSNFVHIVHAEFSRSVRSNLRPLTESNRSYNRYGHKKSRKFVFREFVRSIKRTLSSDILLFHALRHIYGSRSSYRKKPNNGSLVKFRGLNTFVRSTDIQPSVGALNCSGICSGIKHPLRIILLGRSVESFGHVNRIICQSFGRIVRSTGNIVRSCAWSRTTLKNRCRTKTYIYETFVVIRYHRKFTILTKSAQKNGAGINPLRQL